jgi:hypothetical protein
MNLFSTKLDLRVNKENAGSFHYTDKSGMRRFMDIVEARNVLTVYRGEYSGNKGGNFWTEDKEFARQFTQSGQDREILVRYMRPSDIDNRWADTYAGDEAGVDAALAAAKEDDYKAVRLSEGQGEPPSIFVFDKTALMRIPPR